MYLREIGSVALLTAEDEVVLAKSIELGEQIVEAPWRVIVSLHEWTLHDTEHTTRTAKPQHRLPFGAEAHAMVRDAIADGAARDLLVASPAFFLVRAATDARSDGTKALLREARRLVAAYNRSRSTTGPARRSRSRDEISHGAEPRNPESGDHDVRLEAGAPGLSGCRNPGGGRFGSRWRGGRGVRPGEREHELAP
jgi:hypothetical protein